MADVNYGGASTLYLIRMKADHSATLKKKPDATGNPISALTDAEAKLEIIGNFTFNPQSDGSYQLDISQAQSNKMISDLLDNYRSAVSTADRQAYKAIDGTEYGGSSSGSGADPLLVVQYGWEDAADGLQVFAAVCELTIESGSYSLQPDNVTEQKVLLKTIRAQADVIVHDTTGVTLDATLVDVASETSDLTLLDESFGTVFWVTPAA